MGDTGVSLTPTDTKGVALGGSEGRLDGDSVFFGETGLDSGMIVKPTLGGFEEDTLLFSERSATMLSFRVGLPEGASLVQGEASGGVRVVKEGVTLAVIPRPSAEDSEGTVIPVMMSVAGDMLTLSVDSGSVKPVYPVDVDPEVWDSASPALEEGVPEPPSNFHFIHEGSQFTASEEGKGTSWRWREHISGSHKNGEWGALVYTTQGDSYIRETGVYGSWSEKAVHLENLLEIVPPPKKEGEKPEAETKRVLPEESSPHDGYSVSVEESRRPASGNSAQYLTESNGEGSAGENTLESADVRLEQETLPEGHFNTTSPTVDGQPNVLYGTSNWLGPKSGAAELILEDKGIGVSFWSAADNESVSLGGQELYSEDLCQGGIQCPEKLTEYLTYKSGLSNGESTLRLYGSNAFGSTNSEAEGLRTHKLKVDYSPPTGITISGLGSGNEIGEKGYGLKAQATDSLSGIKSIEVSVDGRELGVSQGACSGSCTGKGEWSINGGEFGVGANVLEVTATDNAGNVAAEKYTLKVHHATPVALGPGAVNPMTGEFSLNATDVSVGAPGSSLTVSRSYQSRHLTAGVEGPLGPQWSLSVGGQESLTRLATGSVTLTSASGGQTTFASNGIGGFTSPTGDANLALTEVKNEKGELAEYVLKDAANASTTRFTSTTGPTGTLWKATKQEGPVAAQTVRYIYQTVGGITEPKYALAPEPAGLSFSCIAKFEKSEKLEKGCRALEFKYAEKTKESIGENETEWGEYKGRLKEVLLIAYNTSGVKGMEEPAVAQYSYDKQGRLRAEWNPQLEKPLKVLYGYDAEGHVTAVTPPAQQPWLLHYGTVSGDSNTGRLLSVIRTSAGTELGKGIAPSYTVKPTLSNTKPVVGTKISVSSNGTWSNSPLTYSYQWDDCNSSGIECSAIEGAVNQNYYPAKSDEGHTLVARVTALNGTGAVTAESVATSVVGSGTPSNPLPEPPSPGTTSIWTVDYQVPLSGSELPTLTKSETEKWGQKDDPAESEGIAIFPPDKPMGWPAKEYKRASIIYFDEQDRAVNTYSPSGAISTIEYNEFNDVVRTLSPDSRGAAVKEGAKSAEVAKLLSSESKYNGETKAERETEEKEPGGSAPGTRLLESWGPQHAVRFVHGKIKENEEVQARNHTVYSYDEGEPSTGGPYHLVTRVAQGAQVNGEADRDVRTVTTSYSGQNNLGWKLRKPTSVITDPTGLDLTSSTTYNESTGSVVETQTPGANGEAASELKSFSSFGGSGSGSGQLSGPAGVAVDSSGNVWVVDTGHNRVQEFNSKGEFVREFGGVGTGNGEFSNPHGIAVGSSGNVYVADTGNNRIQEFSSKGEFVRAFGKAGVGNGEFEGPQEVAVDGEGHVWTVEALLARVQEFSSEGVYINKFGKEGTGNGQFKKPEGIAVDSKGNVWVADTGNDRVQELKPTGEFVRVFGKEGSGNGEFSKPSGIVFDAEGDAWVVDTGNDRVQRFTSEGSYLSQAGVAGNENGQFSAPEGIASDSTGQIAVADTSNNRVDMWTPEHRFVDDVKMIYYTAKEEAAVANCRNHLEWANLPCQTEPAAQPTKGDPLPVTTLSSYNILDEPETTTATAGSSTRTTTTTYDGTGHPLTSETTSTEGKAVPKLTNKYSETTGQLIEQSTGTGSEAKTIKSTDNTRGQLTSYTDANGATTTYEYEGEGSYKGEKELDGRLKVMDDGKGTQIYTYEEATGVLSKLVDTQGTNVLTFTASYDVEGNMISEGYPNGMTAGYAHSATGETAGLAYEKTTHCTEKCVWFSESLVPSTHAQTLEDVNSLATNSYTYDQVGRLTEVHETPTGEYCKTRIYAYDEESDRTSLTSREPNSKKECATEGGTIEKHSYDEADRLTDTGVTYNNFGDITKLPASDANGAELLNTYYIDGQLDEQKQGEQTIGYQLDPAGRQNETIDTGTVNSTYQSHYTGPGNSPSWTVEPVSGHWTRYVQGISGLAAIETGTSEPVLQLTDLHGDIVARASLSETATKLLSSERLTEYGVPTITKPEKYSWLGADSCRPNYPPVW